MEFVKGDDLGVAVEPFQRVLGLDAAVLGRLLEPLAGQPPVLGKILMAQQVDHAEPAHRLVVAFFGGAAEPFDGFASSHRGAQAIQVHLAEPELGFSVAGIAGLLVKAQRQRIALTQSVAAQVQFSQRDHRFDAAGAGQPGQRLDGLLEFAGFDPGPGLGQLRFDAFPFGRRRRLGRRLGGVLFGLGPGPSDQPGHDNHGQYDAPHSANPPDDGKSPDMVRV